MDRLSELEAFIRTVEMGSQAAASVALNISRAATGRHIQSLETKLGVRLLQRTTRRQVLTEAGTVFYQQAKDALEQLTEAADSVSKYQSSLRGRLRVCAPMSFGVKHLSSLLAGFSLLYPDVKIELTLSDKVVDLIEEGYDVALRLGKLVDSDMHSRRLGTYRVGLCASPTYLAKHGTPEFPEDLLQHNCLSYVGAGRQQRWTLQGLDGLPQTIAVSGNLTANNGSALMMAALAGLGIIKQPFFIIGDALQDGSLVQVLSGYSLRELELNAIYPAASHLPLKIRVLIDYLADAFSSAGLNSATANR